MDVLKVTTVFLRVNGWLMLFYAIHAATYPLHRLAEFMQRGEAEFMPLSGYFAPDIVRFLMYVAAAFVLIRYSRMLAWLLCRDLLENGPNSTTLKEDA